MLSVSISRASQMATSLASEANKLRDQSETATSQVTAAGTSISWGSLSQEQTEFQYSMQRLRASSVAVSNCVTTLHDQCNMVATSPHSSVNSLASDVQRMISSAQSLMNAFNEFLNHLNDANNRTENMRQRCYREAEEAKSKATATRVGGGVGTGVAASGSVALGVLGFLFPPLWIGAAALGVAAVAGGVATGVDASKLDDQARGFQQLHSTLSSSVQHLRQIGNTFGAMVNAGQTLLNELQAASNMASQQIQSQQWRKN